MLKYESYEDHERHLPSKGRFIIAQFDAESIVVYQAFNEAIAAYALEHGRFGGPGYDDSRITHLKPSFLWMMHYSGWAKESAQEAVLAIRLSRSCFDNLLARATLLTPAQASNNIAEVQLSWQPYHDLHGAKTDRFAAKIGLLGDAKRIFHDGIQCIEDVTPFVREQQDSILSGKPAQVKIPSERAYAPEDFSLLLRVEATSISM